MNIQDNYQKILALIESRSLSSLIAYCQELELDFSIFPQDRAQVVYLQETLLLAYLIDGDLDSARHLCKRASQERSSEFRVIVAILKSMIELKGENVISICFQCQDNPAPVSLKDNVQTMDIDEDHFLKWKEELRPLIRWFSEIFLAKRISSMALSFRTIPIKKSAQLLGLDLDTSVQNINFSENFVKIFLVLQANGWTLSENRKVWTPCKPDFSSSQATENSNELDKGLEHFNLMAKLAIRSES